MKEFIVLVDDSSNSEKETAKIAVNGNFQQNELEMILKVVLLHSKNEGFDTKEMIQNVLEPNEADNLMTVLLEDFLEDAQMDEGPIDLTALS